MNKLDIDKSYKPFKFYFVCGLSLFISLACTYIFIFYILRDEGLIIKAFNILLLLLQILFTVKVIKYAKLNYKKAVKNISHVFFSLGLLLYFFAFAFYQLAYLNLNQYIYYFIASSLILQISFIITTFLLTLVSYYKNNTKANFLNKLLSFIFYIIIYLLMLFVVRTIYFVNTKIGCFMLFICDDSLSLSLFIGNCLIALGFYLLLGKEFYFKIIKRT